MGSFRTLSSVAWLLEHQFLLDAYTPSSASPLPSYPSRWGPPAYITIDAPQGLPAEGRRIRVADQKANTPTRRLPIDRSEMSSFQPYGSLIAAGIDVFWAIYERNVVAILGLNSRLKCPTIVAETYPRYVIQRRWPGLRIPSKSQKPWEYVETMWGLLRNEGYSCASVLRPTVDQVDAMLCALAAEACLVAGGRPKGTVGSNPQVDSKGKVLREGLIVSP